MTFVRGWNLCRGGMGGYGLLPDAGGVGQQAAWAVEAFAALSAADAELKKLRG